MKSCEEMMEHLLERREEYRAARLLRQAKIKKFSVTAVCAVLVVALGAGVWQIALRRAQTPVMVLPPSGVSSAPSVTANLPSQGSEMSHPLIESSDVSGREEDTSSEPSPSSSESFPSAVESEPSVSSDTPIVSRSEISTPVVSGSTIQFWDPGEFGDPIESESPVSSNEPTVSSEQSNESTAPSVQSKPPAVSSMAPEYSSPPMPSAPPEYSEPPVMNAPPTYVSFSTRNGFLDWINSEDALTDCEGNLYNIVQFYRQRGALHLVSSPELETAESLQSYRLDRNGELRATFRKTSSRVSYTVTVSPFAVDEVSAAREGIVSYFESKGETVYQSMEEANLDQVTETATTRHIACTVSIGGQATAAVYEIRARRLSSGECYYSCKLHWIQNGFHAYYSADHSGELEGYLEINQLRLEQIYFEDVALTSANSR